MPGQPFHEILLAGGDKKKKKKVYLPPSPPMNSSPLAIFHFQIIGNGTSVRDGYVSLNCSVVWSYKRVNNLIIHSAFPGDTGKESVDNSLDEHKTSEPFQCRVE